MYRATLRTLSYILYGSFPTRWIFRLDIRVLYILYIIFLTSHNTYRPMPSWSFVVVICLIVCPPQVLTVRKGGITLLQARSLLSAGISTRCICSSFRIAETPATFHNLYIAILSLPDVLENVFFALMSNWSVVVYLQVLRVPILYILVPSTHIYVIYIKLITII